MDLYVSPFPEAQSCLPRLGRGQDGQKYIFKPSQPVDEEPQAYSPPAEAEIVRNKYRHPQGRCIPVCYGVKYLDDTVGLLLQDYTFESPQRMKIARSSST
ncbi:hypothetical protein FQN55_001593 [Onygenales sp. PD_40]|nr:hypothetical protein FQN55_001593 [Onygenales sp. PD_40]